jgi:hypothetical protein
MSMPSRETLPPVSGGLSWTPRVRLYLFEPCDGRLCSDAGAEAPAERPTFDPPCDATPDPERPT